MRYAPEARRLLNSWTRTRYADGTSRALIKALLASLGAGAALVLATVGAPGPVALAHPLGNFTVNRYARVEVTPGGWA